MTRRRDEAGGSPELDEALAALLGRPLPASEAPKPPESVAEKPQEKRGPGRPRKPKVDTAGLAQVSFSSAKGKLDPIKPMGEEGPSDPNVDLDAGAVLRGVSVNWLASVIGMGDTTVRTRLAPCEPIRYTARGAPLYNLRQALPYLMEPNVDVGAIIAKMRPQDLPPFVMKDFWAGMTGRQKFLRESGDVWRTVDVQQVFGEVYKRMRSVMDLMPEQLERTTGLTLEQRKIVVEQLDNLRQLLYDALVDMMKEKRTPSDREKIMEELGVEELEISA